MSDILTAALSCIDGVLAAEESADNVEFRDEVIALASVYNDDSEADIDTNVLALEHKVMLACWNHLKELIENTPCGESVREVMAKEFFSVEPPELLKP